MEIFANIVGNIGVLCFLVSYYFLQNGKFSANSLAYLGLNLAGALLVMFSLIFSWNLPAFLLEMALATISLYGIYKTILNRKNAD